MESIDVTEPAFRRARLQVAHAALQRIRRLWHILFGQTWFSTRYDGDEQCYQLLRPYVLNTLDGLPAFDEARQVALAALPEMLLTRDDMACLDPDVQGHFESGFQQLEAHLVRLALSEGAVLGDAAATEIFMSIDMQLDQAEPLVLETFDREARRLGFLPPIRTNGAAEPTTATERAAKPTRATERAAKRKQEARLLRGEGLTIKEIAQRLRCSTRAVSGYLAETH